MWRGVDIVVACRKGIRHHIYFYTIHRYLLETVKPGPETVINILGIFTRMARHSLTAAWTLVQTPRLLSTIIDNFLPHNVSLLLTGQNVENMTSVYGIPLRHALCLLKVSFVNITVCYPV